jgi:hypothetical protein
MSTALIGGIALQGTPPDYANLAARQKRQESVDEARRSKDSKAAMERFAKAVNVNTHDGFRDKAQEDMGNGFSEALALVSSNKFNELNYLMTQMKNRSMQWNKSGNFLTKIEENPNLLFPEGFREFIRSPEFRANPVDAYNKWSQQDENKMYAEFFKITEGPNGIPTIGHQPIEKMNVDDYTKSYLGKYRDVLTTEDYGVLAEKYRQTLGRTSKATDLYTLQEDFALELLDEAMKTNPALGYNMRAAGIDISNPEALRDFVRKNSPFVERGISTTAASGGVGRGAAISNPTGVIIQVPGVVSNQKVIVDTNGITFLQQSNISMNTSNSVWVGETGQYKQYGKVGSSSKQAVTTNSIVQMPVYTGKRKEIDIGGGKILILEENMPFDSKYYQQAGGNAVNRLFLYGDISDAEKGTKKDTVLIPLTDENMGVLKQQRGGNWATPEYFKNQFPDAMPWGTNPSPSSRPSSTPPPSSTPSADKRRADIEGTGLKKIK